MNKFFMTFVSDIVFNEEERDPDDKVIRWLLDCIVARSGETTRQFSLFNSQEVVDPTPVLRSFLLKLLLSCRKKRYVNTYLDKVFAVSTNHQHQLQTMVLIMNCRKVCLYIN